MRTERHVALWQSFGGTQRRTVLAGAVAGVGGGIAIGVMEWFWIVTHFPLAAIPFCTSIVLVIGGSREKAAQPRALVGGHIVSTIAGLVVLDLAGSHAWAAAVAVGLAILGMYLTGTFHPPAGIDPLLVVTWSFGWWYLFLPVLGGALMLTLFAFVWHRWVRGMAWPQRWF
jgi:CBS-domain-containing membrane protein